MRTREVTTADFMNDLKRFINPRISVYVNRYGYRINKSLRRKRLKKAIETYVDNNKIKLSMVVGFGFGFIADYICSMYWF
jgi:hypothetical protein